MTMRNLKEGTTGGETTKTITTFEKKGTEKS